MSSLKSKVLEVRDICGTHVSLSDPASCEMIAPLGYDFIWIDLEHSELSPIELHNHMNAAKAFGTPTIVRLPMHDLTVTKKVLEMGPDGIIFPMIHNAEEAEKLISYTLYPPYGNRGFGPRRAVRYGIDDAYEYTDKGQFEMCRFIQIECENAINDLEKIVKNPYIDGYIFGPNDLSGSINQLGNMYGDETQKLIKKAIKILKENNKTIGVSTGDTSFETLKFWHDLGVNMISTGADYAYILKNAKSTLEVVREAQR